MDIVIGFVASFFATLLYDFVKWIFLHVEVSIKINK
jgi:hypothetical protein